jgi:hypothetical protein
VFLPRDESSAWAWLPLGIRDTFDSAAASTAGLDADIRFAFGDPAKGTTGFRLTHQQALAARAVMLVPISPARRAVTFGGNRQNVELAPALTTWPSSRTGDFEAVCVYCPEQTRARGEPHRDVRRCR